MVEQAADVVRWIVTLLALLLGARLLLGVLLAFVAPSVRLGHPTLLGWSNAGWQSKHGVTVTSKRVSLAFAPQQIARKAVFLLRIDGLVVKIPAESLGKKDRPERPKQKQREPVAEPDAGHAPPTRSRKAANTVFRSLVIDTWDRIVRLLSILAPLVSLFAIEINARLEIESVATAEAVIDLGIASRDLKIGLCTGVERLRVFHHSTTDDKPAPAIHIEGRSTLAVQVHLARSIVSALRNRDFRSLRLPQSSIDVDIAFPKSHDGLHVRIYQVKTLLAALQDVRQRVEHKSARNGMDSSDQSSSSKRREELFGAQLPPSVNLLRRCTIRAPLVNFSARYSHVFDDAQSDGTQHVAFLASAHDVSLLLEVGGNTDDKHIDKTHKQFLGKNRALGLGGGMSWKEIEVMLQRGDDEEVGILPASAKVLSIGQSDLRITSTWLPPSLPSVSAPDYPARFSAVPRHQNDTALLVSGSLGLIRGHALFEVLDHALRSFMSRPKKHKPTSPGKPFAERIRGLPRCILNLETAGLDVRLQAPQSSPDIVQQPVGKKRDPFFRTWKSPDLFCLSLPDASIAFHGEWVERSVQRTEAERRLAKRLARRRPEPAKGTKDELKEDESNERPTQQLEDELGVPPPPPLSQEPRKRLPNKRSPDTLVDLDEHDIEYHASLYVHTTTLNAYILASNDGFSDKDYKGWLSDRASLPSDPFRFDMLAIGPCTLTMTQIVLGTLNDESASPTLDFKTSMGDVKLIVETVELDLWRPTVMGALRDILHSYSSAKALARPDEEVRPSEPASAFKPLVNFLPADIALYVAIATFDSRIAGSDPKNDVAVCRGFECGGRSVVFETLLPTAIQSGIHYPTRNALHLREDIRVEANATLIEALTSKCALLKLTFAEVSIDPVTDARTSIDPYRKGTEIRSGSIGGEWEMKGRAELASRLTRRKGSIIPQVQDRNREKHGILRLPDVALRVKLGEALTDRGAVDDVLITVETEKVILRLELFTIYLCLVALSAIRSVLPASSGNKTPSNARARPKPLLRARCDIDNVHLFVTLPQDVPLYASVHRPRVECAPDLGVVVEWESLLVAGDCPTAPHMWDDLIRSRTSRLHVKFGPNEGFQPFSVSLQADAARIRVPFKYVVNRIFDNTASLVKSCKQLVHQLIKGETDYVQHPEPEDAKRLPAIDLAFKVLTVECQDDPFETKLNMIWRAGSAEQIARLERETAFETKMRDVRSMTERAWQQEYSQSDSTTQEKEDTSPRRQHHPHHRPPYHHELEHRLREVEEEARADLDAFNSTSWIRRIRNAVAEQSRREDATARQLYGHYASKRLHETFLVTLVPSFRTVPLARAKISGAHLSISKPSFPLEKLPDFVADIGKGMPRDMLYSLLVALHLKVTSDELRCQLRDYPLPVFHVPPVSAHGKSDIKCFELETDLVIAEEMAGSDSIRHVSCAVVPPRSDSEGAKPEYSIGIQRTGLPTKTYADPTMRIRTPYATRFGWGPSMQPAIQDLARVIDTFSKPTADPSERVGFWDKIRLQIHWRFEGLFLGDGPVHFHLKGTRDPYALLGHGAGFSKSWRGDVRFTLGYDNPDREFFQVTAREYILGVPNLRDYIDNAATGLPREALEVDDKHSTSHSGLSSDPSHGLRWTKETEFVKVCAKFVGGVRWGMGAILERTCAPDCQKAECKGKAPFYRKCRFFDFKPHWEVKTIVPEGQDSLPDNYDSFAGFRSDFIHFSISVTSPTNLPLPSTTDDEESMHSFEDMHGYNSLHLTPEGFAHFWRWWRLFDSTMSLPIRQGKLFPQSPTGSKKFGKHCATIKYRLSLAPLFISHTYRQDTLADWERGETTLVGVKARIRNFSVDLHQREQAETLPRKDQSETKTVIHKAFYQAELNINDVDLRAISAVFSEPEKMEVKGVFSNLDEDTGLPSNEFFTPSDDDLEWLDTDDFVDTTYSMPDRSPQFRVFPIATCPCFTYYRYADAERQKGLGPSLAVDGNAQQDLSIDQSKTKFGDEHSHTCLMGHAPNGAAVQLATAEARLHSLNRELAMTKDSRHAAEIKTRIESVNRIILQFAQDRDAHVARARESAELYRQRSVSSTAGRSVLDRPVGEDSAPQGHLPHLTTGLYQDWDDWTNRYVLHNPSIQLTNATREVLLKYYYSFRDRRGFIYHMSAAAVSMIREVTKQHEAAFKKMMRRRKSAQESDRPRARRRRSGKDAETAEDDQAAADMRDRVEGMHKLFEDLDHPQSLDKSQERQPGHLCLFIKPQISLSSDIDDKSTLIVTAFQAQLKSFSVIDKEVLNDPTLAHIQTETYAALDGLQVFYPQTDTRKDRAGRAIFVPLETLIDLRLDTVGFDRIVPRTSAVLRYIKMNQLRFDTQSNRNRPADRSSNGERVHTAPDGTLHSSSPSKSQNGSTDTRLRSVSVTSAASSDRESHSASFASSTAGEPRRSYASSATGGSGLRADGINADMSEPTDSIFVRGDKFSVSANPDHFGAIYNVITDLLLYHDPAQRRRAERLQEIVFKFDWHQLGAEVERVVQLQRRLNMMLSLFHEYQVHVDELRTEDRVDLFSARANFVRMAEELDLSVEAISRAQQFYDPDDKKKKASAGIIFGAHASELVWNMFDLAGNPFVKFGVKGVYFKWVRNQDSTVTNDIRIDDLKALNTSPNQIWPEIIAKDDGDKSDAKSSGQGSAFAIVTWDTQQAVGGIAVIDRFEMRFHPVKLQIEHQVGRRIMNYLFSQRRKQQDERSDSSDASTKGGKTLRAASSSPSLFRDANSSAMRSSESLSVHGISSSRSGASTPQHEHRSKSRVVSLAGTPDTRSLKSGKSNEVLSLAGDEDSLDAAEMRARASMNRTFLLLQVASTNLCLTYHSEKDDDSRLPDVYNIRYRTPRIEYREVTWSFSDLADELRKDVIRSIWSQKGQIVSQLLSKAHRKMPKSLAEMRSTASKPFRERLQRFSGAGSGTARRAVSDSPSLASSHETSPTKNTSPLARDDSYDDDEIEHASDSSREGETEQEREASRHYLLAGAQLTAEPDELSISGSSSTGGTKDDRASFATSSSSSSVLRSANDTASLPALPTVRVHSPQSSDATSASVAAILAGAGRKSPSA